MKINSDFALLDVKRGRAALRKHIQSGGTAKVTITGTIPAGQPWGADDGVSQEFQVDIEKLEVTLDNT